MMPVYDVRSAAFNVDYFLDLLDHPIPHFPATPPDTVGI
jgi:hypothetical protein